MVSDAHHNENYSLDEALQYFETKIMPLVVTNMGIMCSDTALVNVQDLKEKCTFTHGGFKVPTVCWKLEKHINKFYEKHCW